MFDGLFKNTIYVKIKPDLIVVRLIEAKKEIQSKPIVAFDSKHKVLAVGDEALKLQDPIYDQITIVNGFDHPRVIMRDFEAASISIKYFLTKLINRAAILRPIMILHPLQNLDGGISQAEVRMLMDVGIAAGARVAMVWTGRELSDYEIENNQFSLGDGKLFGADFYNNMKKLFAKE